MYLFIPLIPLVLSIIAGKPGSGKTYHMSTLLVDMLTDWVRHEMKEGQPYDSSVWTNIVFNEEGLNETVSKRIGKDVDVWKYMNFCDDSFFNDPSCVYWWKKFPDKALIIIDEVHFYLPKSMDFGSIDFEKEFVNWISVHRHSGQLVYFLTQHTDQFGSSILGIAEMLLEVVNLKTLHLPWPISVPMSDLDELKRSFGITTQYYQANVGNFRGKAIRWSGAAERHLMSSDIYRVYQSHDAGAESSDRPSLKMNALEGICWFARRHAWHLIPKLGVILSIPFVGMFVLMGLPGLLASAMPGGKPEDSVEHVEVVRDESKESRVGKGSGVGKPVNNNMSAPVPGVVSSSVDRAAISAGDVTGSGIEVPSGIGESARAASIIDEPKKLEPKKELKIVMLYQKGVMLNDGSKVTIGETLDIDGSTEVLSVACPTCGVIGFESGKRLKF
jgi:hypothetical protein